MYRRWQLFCFTFIYLIRWTCWQTKLVKRWNALNSGFLQWN